MLIFVLENIGILIKYIDCVNMYEFITVVLNKLIHKYYVTVLI